MDICCTVSFCKKLASSRSLVIPTVLFLGGIWNGCLRSVEPGHVLSQWYHIFGKVCLGAHHRGMQALPCPHAVEGHVSAIWLLGSQHSHLAMGHRVPVTEQ